MEISDEAIVLYYISGDGHGIDVEYDVGESIKITRVGEIPLKKDVLSISLTISTKKTRWMKRALSHKAVDDGCVGLIESIQGSTITITTDLLEESRFYAKFMEL